MPVGSVKKGDRTYFLVEENMQWSEDEEAKAAGQMNVAADLEEIIENAEDLDSWAESFDAVEK